MLLIAILTKDQEREKNCRFAFVVNIQYKESSHLDRLIDGRLRN